MCCRSHCANKLQALYKNLKFQHGRSKFVKRRLEANTITDVRFVNLSLVCQQRMTGDLAGDQATNTCHSANTAVALGSTLHGLYGSTADKRTKPCVGCRHLYIPLFNCERAWAYAMELKKEASLGLICISAQTLPSEFVPIQICVLHQASRQARLHWEAMLVCAPICDSFSVLHHC